MNKQKILKVAMGLFTITLAIVFLIRRQEPEFEGKRLSDWIEELDITSAPRSPVAEKALRYFGTNALPRLLEELRVEDSLLQKQLLDITGRAYFTWAWEHHEHAARGFEALGSKAAPAMSELSIMLADENIAHFAARALAAIGTRSVDVLGGGLTNHSPRVRFESAKALLILSPDSRFAREVIVNSFRQTNDWVMRSYGAIEVARLGKVADSFLPVLIEQLGDKDIFVRECAAEALGLFGKQAIVAIPALTKALADKDGNVRTKSIEALKRIDPEAAAKAGNKNQTQKTPSE